MLNFQSITKEYEKIYKQSRMIDEPDIYVFSDPDWSHPDYPYGLTFFDPQHNCAAILGMRYFGEHKKGTLTLAWGAAARNGYASCHGGMKRYNLNGKSFQAAVFGLSGSGSGFLFCFGGGACAFAARVELVGDEDARQRLENAWRFLAEQASPWWGLGGWSAGFFEKARLAP